MKRSAQGSLMAAALVTTFVGLTVIGTATAQGMGPEGAGAQPPHTHAMIRHAPSAQHHAQRREQRHTAHLVQLKTALKLTSSQEAAWGAYAVRTAPLTHAHPQATSQDLAPLTTPERLDKLMAIKAERDAHLARHIDASRQLYAALTPEQQKVFDGQPHLHLMKGMGMKMKGRHEMHQKGAFYHSKVSTGVDAGPAGTLSVKS